ncbi:MAG: hypothetical protein ACYCWE_09695 [Eubacteriales bacterium]
MLIINQSCEWAVDIADVTVIKQDPCEDDCIGIRATVGHNEFLLAKYKDKSYANTVYTELLSLSVVGNRASHQLPEERDKCDT